MEGQVRFRYVEVDNYGYRVYPGEGDPWDRELADAVLTLARAGVYAARKLGRPGSTVEVRWGGSTLLVKVGQGKVAALLIEEESPPPGAVAGGRATAQV